MERKELVEQLENAFLLDAVDEWEVSTDLLTAWQDDNLNCEYGDDCFDNALLLLETIVQKWHAFVYPTCETKREIASDWYSTNYCFLLEEMKQHV